MEQRAARGAAGPVRALLSHTLSGVLGVVAWVAFTRGGGDSSLAAGETVAAAPAAALSALATTPLGRVLPNASETDDRDAATAASFAHDAFKDSRTTDHGSAASAPRVVRRAKDIDWTAEPWVSVSFGGELQHPLENPDGVMEYYKPNRHPLAVAKRSGGGDWETASDVTEFSWYNVNGESYLTPNKQQHNPHYCHACWAFATTTMIQDRIKIATRATGTAVGPDVELAQQVRESDRDKVSRRCRRRRRSCHSCGAALFDPPRCPPRRDADATRATPARHSSGAARASRTRPSRSRRADRRAPPLLGDHVTIR